MGLHIINLKVEKIVPYVQINSFSTGILIVGK